MALSKISIQNYRSFKKAEVSLSPFTLVIGANGSGKSNFLKALHSLFSQHDPGQHAHLDLRKKETCITAPERGSHAELGTKINDRRVAVFHLDAQKVTAPEDLVNCPQVNGDGSGTTQTLEALKNGDREDLFDRVEGALRKYIPEIEKISFRTENGKKAIQVRERGIESVVPGKFLSEGTRMVLAILTILHQENRPPIVLLEDIDYGLHPRLYEKLVTMMRQIAIDEGVQIVATTHNPYLVDQFKDDPGAVVIVEKKNGASSLTTLEDRLQILGDEDDEESSLGELWYSGFVGGVPAGRL